MSRTLIWCDMEQGKNVPIYNDVINLETGGITESNIILKDISYGNPEHLIDIFSLNNLQEYSLIRVSYLIITREKEKEITERICNTFNELTNLSILIFQIVAIINSIISGIKLHKYQEEKMLGTRLKYRYEKEKQLLKQVIEQYKDYYNTYGHNDTSVMSISFTFPKPPQTIDNKNDITNTLLIKSIMDCLDNMKYLASPMSFDFKEEERLLKRRITEGLFAFLMLPATPWSMSHKSQSYVHNVISTIFLHADITVSVDSIKDWLKRKD